ncbi:carbohydrate sulfotransferase 4-like isoform X2 [Octopus sinensis]|nr:carbohydrate sulfotransferase 4-like isoform X2 [Octopus sinensis]
MRSGSSVTGKILEQARNAIYYFEPLRKLSFYSYANQPLTSIDDKKRYFATNKSVEKGKIQILKAHLNCKFRNTFVETLLDRAVSGCKICKKFNQCLKKNNSVPMVNKCLPQLQNVCNSANVRIAKVIRLDMNLVPELLQSDSNLYVVHLIRDPRAILRSRSKVGLKILEGEKHTKRLCSQIYYNAIKTIELKKIPQFKERIMTLFYENLSENPIAVTKDMYHFLHIPFTENVQEWIRRNMLGKNLNKNPFSVSARNSLFHTREWRLKSAYDFVKDVDEACLYVYKLLGYKAARDINHLRNISESFFDINRF